MMSNSIQGVGTDILEIARIEKSIADFGDKFLIKLFTEREIAYCKKYKNSPLHFAGRFCAKEAVAKCLGTGFGEELEWLEIEILNNTKGQPEVVLSSSASERFKKPTILVSISHCQTYATATAIRVH